MPSPRLRQEYTAPEASARMIRGRGRAEPSDLPVEAGGAGTADAAPASTGVAACSETDGETGSIPGRRISRACPSAPSRLPDGVVPAFKENLLDARKNPADPVRNRAAARPKPAPTGSSCRNQTESFASRPTESTVPVQILGASGFSPEECAPDRPHALPCSGVGKPKAESRPSNGVTDGDPPCRMISGVVGAIHGHRVDAGPPKPRVPGSNSGFPGVLSPGIPYLRQSPSLQRLPDRPDSPPAPVPSDGGLYAKLVVHRRCIDGCRMGRYVRVGPCRSVSVCVGTHWNRAVR